MGAKLVYEKPSVEIFEFIAEQNIASSGNFGPDAICTESGIGD